MRSSWQSFIIRCAYLAIDLGCIWAAFYLACLWRAGTLPFALTFEGFFSDANPFKVIFLFWVLSLLMSNQAQGLYQTKRESLEGVEIWQVIKSVFLASVVVLILSYLMKIKDFPRSIFIISVVLNSILLSMWRVAKKYLVDFLVANGYNNFNALIIGAGRVGSSLAGEIQRNKNLGIRVVGFLDDHKQEGVDGLPVLGKIADFAQVVQREFIHKVYITVAHDNKVFLDVLGHARELGVGVRVVPQGFEFIAQDFVKYNIGVIPVLAYSDMRSLYRQRGKRFFDLCASFFLVVCLLPFLALIAVAIKCDSPGPVFYRSKRYGRRGQIFYMLKFRSMVADADKRLAKLKAHNEADGPIFKMRSDPRITRLGALLRKYSLDELPQIINVLIGDMSLVGPRPLPIDQIEKEDFRQLKRLDIRPGITGLWQIRGRSDVSFTRFLRWDIWYINNWSFGLDIYILLQTIPVVLKGRGAY